LRLGWFLCIIQILGCDLKIHPSQDEGQKAALVFSGITIRGGFLLAALSDTSQYKQRRFFLYFLFMDSTQPDESPTVLDKARVFYRRTDSRFCPGEIRLNPTRQHSENLEFFPWPFLDSCPVFYCGPCQCFPRSPRHWVGFLLECCLGYVFQVPRDFSHEWSRVDVGRVPQINGYFSRVGFEFYHPRLKRFPKKTTMVDLLNFPFLSKI